MAVRRVHPRCGFDRRKGMVALLTQKIFSGGRRYYVAKSIPDNVLYKTIVTFNHDFRASCQSYEKTEQKFISPRSRVMFNKKRYLFRFFAGARSRRRLSPGGGSSSAPGPSQLAHPDLGLELGQLVVVLERTGPSRARARRRRRCARPPDVRGRHVGEPLQLLGGSAEVDDVAGAVYVHALGDLGAAPRGCRSRRGDRRAGARLQRRS